MTDARMTDMSTSTRMDRAWLAELGLAGLPEDVGANLLEVARDTLEYRVGSRIVCGLSDEDLDRFENIYQDGDEQAAVAFLCQKACDYPDLVRSELRRLETEISHAAPAIAGRASAAQEEPDDADSRP